MTIREIIDTYLKSNRLKVDKGNEGDFSPILPLMIMDEAYQIFCEYIRPIECRFESNRLKKDWLKEYHTFNQSYFSHFNQEQIEQLICPAGLTINAQTPLEIALSILAQITMVKNDKNTKSDNGSRSEHAHGLSQSLASR